MCLCRTTGKCVPYGVSCGGFGSRGAAALGEAFKASKGRAQRRVSRTLVLLLVPSRPAVLGKAVWVCYLQSVRVREAEGMLQNTAGLIPNPNPSP